MNDAEKILADAAGYTPQEIEAKFHITETEKEWTVKAIDWLDGPTLNRLVKAFSEKGGGYSKDQNTKRAIFTLPKVADSQISQEEKSQTQETDTPSNGDYALGRSLKGKLGQLVPCIIDAENRVVDGVHRLRENPKAWTIKRDDIKTPVDHALARMTVNFCRRHYTTEEMTNDIGLLMGSGYSVQQIGEITGISERTIYRYMPPQLKKPESQAISQGMKEASQVGRNQLTAVSSASKTQETLKITPSMEKSAQEYLAQEVIECEQCGTPIHRTRASIFKGKLVCPKCAGKTSKPQPQPSTPQPQKVKDSWTHRDAAMKVEKSKEELELLKELANLGITPDTDQWICLWGTKPDGKYGEKKIVYYVHGEVHEKGKALERDDEIVAALEKQGWTVLVFRHGEGVPKEWALQVKAQVKANE